MSINVEIKHDKIVRDALDSFTAEDEAKIAAEVDELLEASMSSVGADALGSLLDTWRDSAKLLQKFINADAVLLSTKENYQNTVEFNELKSMLAQYKFFGALVAKASKLPTSGNADPSRPSFTTLDKMPGETDEEHIERLRRYVNGER